MEPIPDYGDHMTIDDFVNRCREGWLIDYDGYGLYATATAMSNKAVYPSAVVTDLFDRSYTHVVWFNR